MQNLAKLWTLRRCSSETQQCIWNLKQIRQQRRWFYVLPKYRVVWSPSLTKWGFHPEIENLGLCVESPGLHSGPTPKGYQRLGPGLSLKCWLRHFAHPSQFLPRCIVCRAVFPMSVCPSVCLSNAWIVTKRKHLVKKVQLWLIGSRPWAFQWA